MKATAEEYPLPPRAPDSHKGTYGRVLLVAGSEGMTGAAILAARGAYRTGAGLVTVGIDRELFSTVSPTVPEAIFLDLGPGRVTGPIDVDGYDAVLVGPGLGATMARAGFREIIDRRKGPLVVDADGLNAIAADGRFPHPSPARIWTPHPGEFARLTGEKPKGDAERVAAAERFVRAHGGVLVLKGHRTVVMDAERYAINETGNPGMATAGAGDVLAGMIVALLGQGMEPFAAARSAVHIHGLAGDLAAKDLGMVSVVAGDLVQYIPRAIRTYSGELPCKKV
jgi:hydroxyethylthiazole kinase-like uncharacterized protein yjeF